MSASPTTDHHQVSDIKSKFENTAHNDVPILRKTRPSTRRTNDEQPPSPGGNKMANKRISSDLNSIFSKRTSVSSIGSGTGSARSSVVLNQGTGSARNSAILNRNSTSSNNFNDSFGELRSKFNRNSIPKDPLSKRSSEPNQDMAPEGDEKLMDEENNESTGISEFDLDSVVIESQKLSHLTTNRAHKTNQRQRRPPSKFAKK